MTSRATNAEIEVYMKKWLRNAADRMGGRSARMRKMMHKANQLRGKKKDCCRAASDHSSSEKDSASDNISDAEEAL